MIALITNKPSYSEFQELMKSTDTFLNEDAIRREPYYRGRTPGQLECDIRDALSECAKGTSFQGTIQLVSGHSFPDIVASRFYGVEVKSTNKNHWVSTGSSILESTRLPDVERIYLTFGKLYSPVMFLSKPYEECMSEIAVTHYPRYKIDMKLQAGQTIFDKMGISYDVLRRMDNPVTVVSQYYKKQLKKGESLWWVGSVDQSTAPMTVRLWTTLTPWEKNDFIVQGYALFPEILRQSDNTKYNRYALWLATQKGIICSNARDGFSAGGKVDIVLPTRTFYGMPAAFGRINENRRKIVRAINDIDEDVLKEYWSRNTIDEDRVAQWQELVAIEARNTIGYETAKMLLAGIFSEENLIIPFPASNPTD